jgi:hypothetical protein
MSLRVCLLFFFFFFLYLNDEGREWICAVELTWMNLDIKQPIISDNGASLTSNVQAILIVQNTVDCFVCLFLCLFVWLVGWGLFLEELVKGGGCGVCGREVEL